MTPLQEQLQYNQDKLNNSLVRIMLAFEEIVGVNAPPFLERTMQKWDAWRDVISSWLDQWNEDETAVIQAIKRAVALADRANMTIKQPSSLEAFMAQVWRQSLAGMQQRFQESMSNLGYTLKEDYAMPGNKQAYAFEGDSGLVLVYH